MYNVTMNLYSVKCTYSPKTMASSFCSMILVGPNNMILTMINILIEKLSKIQY